MLNRQEQCLAVRCPRWTTQHCFARRRGELGRDASVRPRRRDEEHTVILEHGISSVDVERGCGDIDDYPEIARRIERQVVRSRKHVTAMFGVRTAGSPPHPGESCAGSVCPVLDAPDFSVDVRKEMTRSRCLCRERDIHALVERVDFNVLWAPGRCRTNQVRCPERIGHNGAEIRVHLTERCRTGWYLRHGSTRVRTE